mgnify:CR=1 FL=1
MPVSFDLDLSRVGKVKKAVFDTVFHQRLKKQTENGNIVKPVLNLPGNAEGIRKTFLLDEDIAFQRFDFLRKGSERVSCDNIVFIENS